MLQDPALSEPSEGRTETSIEVTGPVTLAEVARWQGAFAEVLSRGHGLRIDLAGSGPWDVAGVQLLLATMASAERCGRPVALVGVPDVLVAVAQRAALGERLATISVDQARADHSRGRSLP
jgi:ABC-type transporter Mla MlaB component